MTLREELETERQSLMDRLEERFSDADMSPGGFWTELIAVFGQTVADEWRDWRDSHEDAPYEPQAYFLEPR